VTAEVETLQEKILVDPDVIAWQEETPGVKLRAEYSPKE
jgi:hypothetical protein